MRQLLDRLMTIGAQRPRLTLALFVGVALACAGAALTLTTSSSLNTLVSSSTPDYQASQVDAKQFGGDAVDVLVREPLDDLIGAKDLGALSELEACLDGQQVAASSSLAAFLPVAAAKAKPYGGADSACGHLMAAKPAQVVYGPATFLNQAVIAVNRQLESLLASLAAAATAKEKAASAAAARKGLSAAQQRAAAQAASAAARSSDTQQLLKLMSSSGLSEADLPSIDNSTFISTIVLNSGTDTPKARFSYLFPTANSALIQVRLKPDLSSSQTAQAIRWIRQATQMPTFALSSGGSYLVSGEPVLLSDLSESLAGQVLSLLIGAVVVMAVVLVLTFRRRRRLLPLGFALAGAAITFGLWRAGGGSLTIASIAVLPILIGLGVDYGIQFQSRASGAATIAAAALATATGFLVLLLSPVPMVRGFGLLLVIGVVVAFGVVLIAGSAALALPSLGVMAPRPLLASLRGAEELLAGPTARGRRSVRTAAGAAVSMLGALGRRVQPLGRGILPALRGAGEILGLRRLRGRRAGAGAPGSGGDHSGVGVLLAGLSRRPVAVLGVGLVLAAGGWFADAHTSVQSDVTKLVPRNMPSLRALDTLEATTGESGELDVLVHGANVASPATIAWMVTYEQAMVSHFGYSETTGCQAATICPALSLPDLFESSTSSSSSSTGASLTQAQINSLLAAVPAYFSQAVVNHDRTYATLAFGVRLMPLAKQIRVVAYMRAHLDPPAGVSARLAGLPVLAADGDAALSSTSRRLVTLVAGLGAVALMLLAIFRRPRRALVPLVPIVLATGWSALIVWLIGIPLNPMSATLGALVIAISTEFSVLLCERFRHQREAGEEPALALANAYRSTGKAVLASGITAIAGFAVLIVSDVTMLRDFGLVTLIDMSVSLLGVLAVLPAVLTLSESGRRQAGAGAGAGRIPWPRRVSRRGGPGRRQVPA